MVQRGMEYLSVSEAQSYLRIIGYFHNSVNKLAILLLVVGKLEMLVNKQLSLTTSLRSHVMGCNTGYLHGIANYLESFNFYSIVCEISQLFVDSGSLPLPIAQGRPCAS